MNLAFVFSGPPVFIDPASNYTAYSESNLTINFDFYSSPDVVKFEWRRHGKAFAEWDSDTDFTDTNVTLTLGNKSIHVPGRTVSVQLTNVTLDMAGNYSLFLGTKIEEQSQHDFMLSVLEEGRSLRIPILPACNAVCPVRGIIP